MIELPESGLPEKASELVRLIGMAAATKLVCALGGVNIAIPKGDGRVGTVRREALIEIVGVAATDMLIAHYGGDRLWVPSCRQALLKVRNVAIVRQYERGKSVQDLALQYELTDRHIWTILKTTDASARSQLQLF